MERLGPDAMLILWSAPAQRYSLDIDYEYRQDSNLYYLTGITQEGTILVLMPGNVARREVLFVKDKDPAQEHWRGRTLTTDEARARTGIDTVLSPASSSRSSPACWAGRASGADHRAGRRAILRGAVGGPRAPRARATTTAAAPADRRPRPVQFAQRMRERFVGFTTTNVDAVFDDLRTVKTPYERKVLVEEPRDLERRADGRHARGAARRLRVRGEGRDRGRASGPRRRVVELPVDCRQRTERDDPPLPRRRPADAGRRPAAGRRRLQLRLHVGRHHAHLSGQRHVLAGAEGHLPHRAAGAGGRRQDGRRGRAPRSRTFTRRPSR